MKDATPTIAPKTKWIFDVDRLRLPALALLSFVYVFGSNWLFLCRYGINDNYGILEYAQHGMPSILTGLALVKLLHLAYSTAPGVPWHGLCYYLFHVLSVFVWLWSFSRVFRPWWLAAAFSTVFLGYYLPYLLFLDYTTTSAMLCAGSLVWAFLEVLEEAPGYLRFLAPGVMFTLGELARPEVPLGSLSYAFPLALLVIFWKMRLQTLRRAVPRLALISLIFFAPMLVNLAGNTVYAVYFKSPQQLQYERFDAARKALEKHTTRPTKRKIMRDAPLLASVGWTFIDAYHMFNWNYLDERVDTVQALQTLLEKAPPQHVAFRDFIGSMRGWFDFNQFTVLLLGSALISLLILRCQPWLGTVALAAPFYCIVFSTFMSLYFTYTSRTQDPLVTAYGFLALIISYRIATAAGQEQSKLPIAVALVSILLAGIGAYSILSAEAAVRDKHVGVISAAQEQLDILNQDYAGSVILMDPNGGMPIFKLDPLKYHPVLFQPIDLGWSTFSPLFYQQIAKLGIQHGYQLVDALIANQNAYELGDQQWCENLLDYASNRGQRHIDVVEVRKLPGGRYNLYRFEEKNR